MTTPTPLSASEKYSTELLPRDKFRTLVAVAIVLLTIGGWISVLMTADRFALSAQTRLWWIEQITVLVLAIVCICIVLRRRAFLTLAFWLTIYSMLFKIMRWYFEFKGGQLAVPVALILYALFIWRLHLARRTVAAEEQIVAV